MKYLKKFENNKEILYHKNDIIISEWYKTAEVFLVLNDVYITNDKSLLCIYIGCISRYTEPYYSIFFNEEKVKIEDKNNDETNCFRKISDLELEMMTKVIFSNDTKVNYHIDIIKNKTGVDLKELPLLKEFEIKRIANKFNL